MVKCLMKNCVVEFIALFFLSLFDIIISTIKLVTPERFFYKSITGQTVLITGAGSGVGALLAQRFAKLKCKLVLWDINYDALQNVAMECRSINPSDEVLFYRVDLAQKASIKATADKVKRETERVDILINNAGIVTGKPFMECTDEEIERTMAINAEAHFWTTRAFLPGMLARSCGHVVSIASAAGLFGSNRLGDYSASKFAVVGFDEALRSELMAEGVWGKVNTTVVCPMYINTGMFEGVVMRFPRLFPIMEPDYVVSKIVSAVLTNQTLLCIPRIVYWFSVLKSILPVRTNWRMAHFFGFTDCMLHYRGRQQERVPKRD